MKLFQSALLCIAILLPATALAQGCSQCAQTIGQTPPSTRAAYRKAIIVMVIAGTTVFAAGIIAIRRFR